MTSITSIVKYLKHAHTISKQFKNLTLVAQIEVIYGIRNVEKIRLYTMIKATFELYNINLQEREFLPTRKENWKLVFRIIIKISKNLEADENFVGQANSGIVRLHISITKV